MNARVAESMLALAERVTTTITGPSGKASLGQLEDRHADLLGAIQWFVDERRPDEALRLANALYRFGRDDVAEADRLPDPPARPMTRSGRPRIPSSVRCRAAALPSRLLLPVLSGQSCPLSSWCSVF